MFDLATLTAGTKAIGSLYSGLKAVVDVKRDLDIMDKLEKILELRGTLLDAKEEIMSLREQVSALSRELETTANLSFDQRFGCYFLTEGGHRHALCSKCWNIHKRKAPLKLDEGAYFCPTCDTWYADGANTCRQTRADHDPFD